jgi:hypothetical protein
MTGYSEFAVGATGIYKITHDVLKGIEASTVMMQKSKVKELIKTIGVLQNVLQRPELEKYQLEIISKHLLYQEKDLEEYLRNNNDKGMIISIKCVRFLVMTIFEKVPEALCPYPFPLTYSPYHLASHKLKFEEPKKATQSGPEDASKSDGISSQIHTSSLDFAYDILDFLQENCLLTVEVIWASKDEALLKKDIRDLQEMAELIRQDVRFHFIKAEVNDILIGLKILSDSDNAEFELMPLTNAVCSIFSKLKAIKEDVRTEMEKKLISEIVHKDYYYEIENYDDLEHAKEIVKTCPARFSLICNPPSKAYPPGLFYHLECNELDPNKGKTSVFRIICKNNGVNVLCGIYDSIDAYFKRFQMTKKIYPYTGLYTWKELPSFYESERLKKIINGSETIMPKNQFCIHEGPIPWCPILSVNGLNGLEHYWIVPQTDCIFMNGRSYASFANLIEALKKDCGWIPYSHSDLSSDASKA